MSVIRPLAADSKPFKTSFTEAPNIPRKLKKAEPSTTTNGTAHQNGRNGVHAENSAPQGVKRPHSEDDNQPIKKARTAVAGAGDDDIVVVDDAGGAIVIDDD